jgi:hypothetical protein
MYIYIYIYIYVCVFFKNCLHTVCHTLTYFELSGSSSESYSTLVKPNKDRWIIKHIKIYAYSGADKSLAWPTSRFILFDGWNILFDASLVIYINRTNIPPIMIINMIYETQNRLLL